MTFSRDLGPEALPVLILMDRLCGKYETLPGRVIRRIGVRDQDPLVGFSVIAGKVLRQSLSELDRQFLKLFLFIGHGVFLLESLFFIIVIQPVVRIILGYRRCFFIGILRQFIDIHVVVIIFIAEIGVRIRPAGAGLISLGLQIQISSDAAEDQDQRQGKQKRKLVKFFQLTNFIAAASTA